MHHPTATGLKLSRRIGRFEILPRFSSLTNSCAFPSEHNETAMGFDRLATICLKAFGAFYPDLILAFPCQKKHLIRKSKGMVQP